MRFILTVNELPHFSDASLALESRLLILPFARSLAGREDLALETKLKAEAPGILNWALGGLFDLLTHGRFILPEKSRAILDNYRRMVSAVVAFLEDLCEVGPEHSIRCDELYAAWRIWTEQNGHKPGANVTFGEHLRSADPTIVRRRPRHGDDRVYVYAGICLTELGEAEVAKAAEISARS